MTINAVKYLKLKLIAYVKNILFDLLWVFILNIQAKLWATTTKWGQNPYFVYRDTARINIPQNNLQAGTTGNKGKPKTKDMSYILMQHIL